MLGFDYSLLRDKMQKNGYTLLTLGNKVGISEGQLCHKLNGHYPFKQDDIIKICDVLNIPAKDISKYFFCVRT